MVVQQFKFKGTAIRPDVLGGYWRYVKRLLAADGYSVEGIEMPNIEGLVLSTDRWTEALEQIDLSPYYKNTTGVKHGKQLIGKRGVLVFHAAGPKWIVLVWENARPMKGPVRHELLHIWESLLGLSCGTLTKKYPIKSQE
jgi:hypothetical protein